MDKQMINYDGIFGLEDYEHWSHVNTDIVYKNNMKEHAYQYKRQFVYNRYENNGFNEYHKNDSKIRFIKDDNFAIFDISYVLMQDILVLFDKNYMDGRCY